MKMLYIGNFEPSFSTENHYRMSFEALGVEVVPLQENRWEYWEHTAFDDVDLVLYTRTWGVVPESFLRRMEAQGAITAGVHLDKWHGLHREADLVNHSMFSVGHFFTCCGDDLDAMRQVGINAHYLPAGVVDPRLVGERVPGNPNPGRWPWSVVFVGSYDYHPEHPRAQLIDACQARWGERFGRVAGDTSTGTLREQELDDLYATVPVVVGDSCFASWECNYWSDRFYETWGRGGFLVFPRIWSLMQEIGGYPSYEAGDYESLFREVDFWLSVPEHRLRVSNDLRHLVWAKGTYTQRAAAILKELGLEASSRPNSSDPGDSGVLIPDVDQQERAAP